MTDLAVCRAVFRTIIYQCLIDKFDKKVFFVRKFLDLFSYYFFLILKGNFRMD